MTVMRLKTALTTGLIASAAALPDAPGLPGLPCECGGGHMNPVGSQLNVTGGYMNTSGGGESYDWAKGANGTVKGVNLGGWLLLEPWITPSLFPNEDIVDEYTLGEKDPNASKILKKHWESFITKKDFQEIRYLGFNMVRIGIGYWAFKKLEDDPYIAGAAIYLDRATDWADEVGIKIIVDLHGAPGSQNGFDNSGQLTKNASWTKNGNVEHTLEILQRMADRYGNKPAVAAIGLLNEPFPEKLGYQEQTLSKVVSFHNCAAKVVRKASSPKTAVTISDAFTNAFKWNDEYEEAGPGANIIDHHDYQVFDDVLLGLNLTAHLDQVTLNIDASVANSTHPTIIGEWSGALTDCAKYLNGRKDGARFESKFSGTLGINRTCPAGENDKSAFEKDAELKSNLTQYLQKQIEVFDEKTNGWFFWTWKTESAPAWDAQFLNKIGIFPRLGGAGNGTMEGAKMNGTGMVETPKVDSKM